MARTVAYCLSYIIHRDRRIYRKYQITTDNRYNQFLQSIVVNTVCCIDRRAFNDINQTT